MTKIERRTMLRTLGNNSVGSLIPLSGRASNIDSRLEGETKMLETDILVIGGGTAGVIAAIQAGRAGFITILVENGSQLGGTTTTGGVSFPGLFHAWGKQVISGIGWEMVMDAVNLDGGELPDFRVPTGRQYWKHQIRLNPYICSFGGRKVFGRRSGNKVL